MMKPQIAWITGAGKGIGRALALQMAAEGAVIAASARSEADLQSLAEAAEKAGGIIRPYRLDITDAQAVAETVRRIEAELGPIDIAVLNAGTHEETSGADFRLDVFRRVVETNLHGASNCLAAVLPPLVGRGAGTVAVVASLAGLRGLPTAGAYAASKAGLIALCESMEPELAAKGVRLKLVNPGFVDTPLTQLNTFPMPFLISAEKAATIIRKRLAGSGFEIAFPWSMALAMRTLRLLPYRVLFALTRGMVRPPR